MSGGFEQKRIFDVEASPLDHCDGQNSDILHLYNECKTCELLLEEGVLHGAPEEEINRLHDQRSELIRQIQILRASVATHLLEDLVPMLNGLAAMFQNMDAKGEHISNEVTYGRQPLVAIRSLSDNAEEASLWVRQISQSLKKNLVHMKDLSHCLISPGELSSETASDPVVVVDTAGGARQRTLTSDFSPDEFDRFLANRDLVTPRPPATRPASRRGEGGRARSSSPELMEVDREGLARLQADRPARRERRRQDEDDIAVVPRKSDEPPKRRRGS